MDPSVSGPALAALGEDLFLLSIRRRDGRLLTRGRIDSALMASELIRLAAAGRAWMAESRIVARDQTATGDAELDAALLSLAGATFPPRPETWVGLPRRGIRAAYAGRLTSAGALRLESSRVLGIPRYRVIDPSRVAAAQSRLDAATQSSGPQPDSARAALAALASAIGLGDVLYPGRAGQAQRAKMAWLARQQVTAYTTAGRGSRGDRVTPAGQVTGPAPREPAGELVRRRVAEGAKDPAVLSVLDDVIATAVHALTAVIDSSAIVGSDVVDTHFLGIYRGAGRGGAEHRAGIHGHGGQGDGGHAGPGGLGHH